MAIINGGDPNYLKNPGMILQSRVNLGVESNIMTDQPTPTPGHEPPSETRV